jgi:hypothetical protein
MNMSDRRSEMEDSRNVRHSYVCVRRRAPLLVGVYRGAWRGHGPWSNSDPDTWIHTFALTIGLFIVNCIAVETYRWTREMAARKKVLEQSKGLKKLLEN